MVLTLSRFFILAICNIGDKIKNMKDIYLVDTPLQIYNSVIHKLSHNNFLSDIIIVNKFNNADILAERLRKLKIFEKVFLVNIGEKGLVRNIWTVIGIFSPFLYTRLFLKLNIRKSNYAAVYISFSTKIFDNIINASGADRIYGIEDGIGTYYGDVFRQYADYKYLFIRKFLRHDYSIDKLFIKNMDYYEGTYKDRIEYLGVIDDRCNSVLNKLFPIDAYSNIYEKKKFIYLNEPMVDYAVSHIDNEEIIFKSIHKSLGNNMLVRLHPRETKRFIYSKALVDYGASMWEHMCRNYIDDNSVLISICSTAQFVPKFIYNREPFVVFTFKLYNDLDEKERRKNYQLYKMLKKAYKNSERVIAVSSIEKMNDMLFRLRRTKYAIK